jgi:hypothetical protein
VCFKISDCIDPNRKASWIRHSQYLACLGNSGEFTAKKEEFICKALVFISDGVTWIGNWIKDAHPDAPLF